MSIDQAYNFKRVSDSVSTSGLLSVEQLEQLGTEGYGAVINLLPADSEYAIEGEASIVEKQGIIYEYIPVDFSSPTAIDYQLFSEAMSKLSNAKLMVHCAANYRVSAFYAVYAYSNLGWSVGQAEEFIASIWAPAEYPAWEAFISRGLEGKDA